MKNQIKRSFLYALITIILLGTLSSSAKHIYAQVQAEPDQTTKMFLPLIANSLQATQETSNRQLRYQVGHTYTYQWDLTIQTQSASKDSQGVHEEGNTAQITGLVDLQVLDQGADGTYQLSLAVRNPTIVASMQDPQVTTLDDPELIAALNKPLLFKQANTGEISEVRYPQDAPATVVEMQKGIVNALQITLKPDAQYTVEEEGGQGRYQSHYTITEETTGVQISKQISDQDFLEMVSAGDAATKIQLQNRVDMVLDTQQGAPQSIHVVEQISAGDQSDTLQATTVVTDAVAVTTKVVSDGWLRLREVQQSDNSFVIAATTNYVQGSLRATLSDAANSEPEIDLSGVQIDSELQNLAQAPTNPALTQRLAALIRQDQSQQMLKAVQTRLNNTNDEQIAGSYIAALSMAATSDAQEVLIDNVLAAPVNDALKIQALTELATVKQPSMRLVDVVTTLSQNDQGELSTVALLTLGSLADTLQATDPSAADQIATGITMRLQQAQTPEVSEQLLLALGNAGSITAQDTIVHYLSDDNPILRGAAMLALRKLPVKIADSRLIASLMDDPSAYVQEMAATALMQRMQNPALRTAEATQVLEAYATVNAAAVNSVFAKNWSKSFNAGPVTINLPGDFTVKSAPDAPALTLDANQYGTGSVMGINFNLFRARLLSDVPAGTRRVGAYFWIGNNTLMWKHEVNVPCSFTKNGTFWEGTKPFFNFTKSIPVYWILTVDLHAEATGYAKISYDYQHQLCAGNAATATGAITPQIQVAAKGSAYLSLLLVRGGVVLTADILKASLPARVSASLSQSGSSLPMLSACIDAKATIEPLSGKLEANAQRRKYVIGGSWKNIGTWNIWSFAIGAQNYTLWAQCWPEAPGSFNKTYPSSNATNVPVSINLTWNASARASYYLVCVDTTADLLCNGLGDNTNFTRVNGTSYSVNLAPGTTYSWQVRAVGANGVWTAADGSGQWGGFTTGGWPGPFNKTYPGNNTTDVPASINLTWGPSAGASYYLVCIDTTADLLCNGVGDNTNFTRVNGTSYSVNLALGTTYSWQVRAIGSNGNWTPGNGSGGWWNFTTGSYPAPFNKTYPGNNTTGVPTSINLTWNASAGASYYLVCVDTTADLLCNGSGDHTNFTRVNGTSYYVNLAPGTTYSWQVRAMGTNGNWTPGNGSGQWWTFRTR